MIQRLKIELTAVVVFSYSMVMWGLQCEPGECIQMVEKYWLPVWGTGMVALLIYIIWRQRQ